MKPMSIAMARNLRMMCPLCSETEWFNAAPVTVRGVTEDQVQRLFGAIE